MGDRGGDSRLKYNHLPPDVWSECLHYLPPDELSRVSQLLPLLSYVADDTDVDDDTDNDNDDDTCAERAAWMAVRSMVGIAQQYWTVKEEEDMAAAVDSRDSGSGSTDNETTTRDTEAIEIQRLVSNDTTIIGDLIRTSRNNINNNNSSGEKGQRQRQRQTEQQQQQKRRFFRFQDETWQGLYGLLHTILSEVVVDDDDDVDTATTNNETSDSDTEDEDEDEDEMDETEQGGGDAVDGAAAAANGVGREEEEETIAAARTAAENHQHQHQHQTTENNNNSSRVYDHEYIALSVGLIFNAPPLPALLMNEERREKLASIARACSAYSRRSSSSNSNSNSNSSRGHDADNDDIDNDNDNDDDTSSSVGCLLSNTRCSLLSLRLGNAGLWNIASDILQSRSSFTFLDDNGDGEDDGDDQQKQQQHPNDDNAKEGQEKDTTPKQRQQQQMMVLLSIDGMIYSSTFLIDRLYSQTYVRNNNEDDTTELVTAVRLGRKAVEMAEKRYTTLFCAKQTTATHIKDKGWCCLADDDDVHDDDENESVVANNNSPPPPIESLFANDALRYIHARLALAKALALLAQHVGLGASDIRTLGILPATFTEEERREALQLQQLQNIQEQQENDFFRMTYKTAHYFFLEGHEQYSIIFSTFEEQYAIIKETKDYFIIDNENKSSHRCRRRRQATIIRSKIRSLLAAIRSAHGELSYCAASVESRIRQSESKIYALKSISTFSKAFRQLMEEILARRRPIPSGNGNGIGIGIGGGGIGGSLHSFGDDDDGNGIDFDDNAIEILIRCGKDLGKTCEFAKYLGIDHDDLRDEQGRIVEPTMFLDFAYIFSVYQHGSYHPTTKNIKRLCLQYSNSGSPPSLSSNNSGGDGSTKAAADMYNRVVMWLVEEYYYNCETNSSEDY